MGKSMIMKERFRLLITVFLAAFIVLSAVSCGEKTPDMEALKPELEALGMTVDGDTVILSHDSEETQKAQWLFLEDSFDRTEHINIQVTGKVDSYTVVATHREYSYFYLCTSISEEVQGIPVAISKALCYEFINTHMPDEMFIPEGTTVRLTGTLEMYEQFMGWETMKCPVLILTSIEYIQSPEAV